ncbi:MAG: GspH/FimT family protein [Defluviitaleaceae bacterium]|nr:GspH/FimT family protein [Defluviitaleaceae bacterium]
MNKGVTLIELTIALAVLTIIAGAVVLGVSAEHRDSQMLYNAAVELQADMRYAQRRSIQEGRRVYILFEPSLNRYRMFNRNPYNAIRTVYFDTVNLVGTSFNPHNSAINRINFTPQGTASASGTVTLSNGRDLLNLTTTVSGGRVDFEIEEGN